jgi:sugar-specific transcriptional regulator TrmB
VYVALLSEHPATGYQLSKASGVPRSMVYEALKRLHARGAALESVEGRATLYRPLPPDMLLDRHEMEHQRLVGDLRHGLQKLFTASVDNRIWSLSGRSTVLAYAAQLIHKAQTELFLVLTDEDLAELRAELAAAHERGVAVNALLTGTDELSLGGVAYHPPLESELQGLTTTLLVEADDVEVLIASAGAQQKTLATVTRNNDLVLIARQFVWMELLTQRIYSRLGLDLLARLDPEDRRIFESLRANMGQ